jgi:hypothetical protein
MKRGYTNKKKTERPKVEGPLSVQAVRLADLFCKHGDDEPCDHCLREAQEAINQSQG